MTDIADITLDNLPKPWTLKQAKFALALLADPKRHAGKAAREAGFSDKAADAQASRLLNDVKFKHVRDYITAREEKIVSKYAYQHEKHIRDTVRQSRANILDFFTVCPETGNLRIDWREVPYELGELISSVRVKQLSIKTVEGGEEISMPVLDTEFKLWDKNVARDQLNRIMGSYNDKIDHTGEVMVKIVDDIK